MRLQPGNTPKASRFEIGTPKIVDILLVQIQADKPVDIAQVVVQFGSCSSGKEHVVFESCIDAKESKWKIVDKLSESDEYFIKRQSK